MNWEEILNSIGAEKSNWRLLKPELRELSGKMKRGELLTGEEVERLKKEWQSTNPFCNEDGKPFVLFIYDRASRWSFFWGSKYKFHFKWCSTLKKMDKSGRRARYKAKLDLQNPLFESSANKKERLDVCLNCLKSFNFYERTPNVKEFNIKEFFDTYGLQNLRQPTHQYYTHRYTRDWQEVSRRHKESKNWVCESCNQDFSHSKTLLHTHHINGVKDDNTSANLQALCYKCHSKQPAHMRMM